MENKNNSNVKWYDRLLIGILIFIIPIFFISYFDRLNFLLIISIGLFITFIIFFNWGMIYHKFKNKKYTWLVIDIALLFVGLIIISNIIFYFTFMRKEFEKEKK